MKNVKNSQADTNPATVNASTEHVAIADAICMIGGKGVSKVTGFHYIGDWCSVSLANGVKGIVGKSDVFTFGTMLTLKGASMEVHYERVADRNSKGTWYKSYILEWSLE